MKKLDGIIGHEKVLLVSLFLILSYQWVDPVTVDDVDLGQEQ